jgi:hypothetical protein
MSETYRKMVEHPLIQGMLWKQPLKSGDLLWNKALHRVSVYSDRWLAAPPDARGYDRLPRIEDWVEALTPNLWCLNWYPMRGELSVHWWNIKTNFSELKLFYGSYQEALCQAWMFMTGFIWDGKWKSR